MLNKINISPDRQKLIVYLVLTVVTLAVFWQVNQYDFVFDDSAYVTENSHIQSGITLDRFYWAFSTISIKQTGLWNPLVWLSFMFDYQLHGLNAGGYHLTNVILHVMSALLLFWLFNRMTGAIWRSAFVAALFALHPLHVESVAWIAERKDVLSAFFWMLTLCLYVYYTEKPVIRRYLPVLLCFACALMSKPMVITLPIVMILLDYWPLDRLQSRETWNPPSPAGGGMRCNSREVALLQGASGSCRKGLHSRKIVKTMPEVMSVSTNKGKKKNKFKKEALKKSISPPNNQKLSEPGIAGIIPLWQLWEKIPFFILSAIIVIITLYTPNTPDMLDSPDFKLIPLISRLANAPVAFVTYLEKTFWPHNMAVFYPFPDQIPLWQVLRASLLILIITTAVIVMIKRLPYLFAGWMWFSITIAPVIGIIQVSIAAPYAMADRYHYLPSIGLAVMLAWGIPASIKSENLRKKVIFPAGIIFLAIISFLSWNQCGYWKNSIELFSHALKVTDDNWLAYNNRGNAYADLGNDKQAIEDYNEAIRLKADSDRTYYDRGSIYVRHGQYQLAIEDFNKAIGLNPYFIQAYNNRGIAYTLMGIYQKALEDFNEAIILKSDHANSYNMRAFVYLNQGDNISGCRDARKACELGNCKTLEAAKGRGLCR
jgi:Tfp pilus assembly protein PilF